MKIPHFYVSVALGAICLILSIAVTVLGQGNQRLQAQLQGQQEEINRGNNTIQVSRNLLQDMAQVALKNDKIKSILARNGYNVEANPAPSASPAP